MQVNILDYGAVPGTGAVNTAAIQRAIDDCAARFGGTVTVPAGCFVSGTLYLRSNVELHLDMGAELRASTDPADYNARDAYPENFSVPDEGWEGKHFIIAHGLENTAITGAGTINGSAELFFDGEAYDPGFHDVWSYGLQYQKGFRYGMERSDNPRPGQTVVFIDCRNVRVTDVTIINSPAWCLFFHGCENVQVRGYRAYNRRTWANTDGLDIDTCRNVTVSDCIIDTGDDAIAIRCSAKRLKNGRTACENITVTNCVLASSSSVFRIGVGAGEIRRVVISGIAIHRGGVAFTVATHFSPACHGLLEDILVRDIAAENISVPFALTAREDCYIRNVSFQNFRAGCFKGCSVIAEDDAEIRGITLRDVQLSVQESPFAFPILDERGGNELLSLRNVRDVYARHVTAEIAPALRGLIGDSSGLFDAVETYYI